MPTVRLPLAVGLALALQLWSWQQITRDTETLLWGVVVIAVTGVSGWVTRALRLSPALALPLQTAVVAATVVLGVALRFGAARALGVAGLATGGVTAITTGSAPLPPHAGVMFLLCALVALIALAADWIACVVNRPAGVAVPLLALYAVVAVGLGTAMLFSEFALFAVGLVLVLLAALPSGDGLPAGQWGAATASAAVVTAGALVATWAVADALPDLEAPRARAPLQMSDPSLDLKRNLAQGSDDVVVTYTTDQPTGAYLKLATLPRFTAQGFGLQDVRVATGRLPAPPGVQPGTGTRRVTEVQIGDFASEWLPAPYAPLSFDAEGDWGFALDTLDVMALEGPGRSSATRGLRYTVTSLDVRPDDALLATAGTSLDDGRQEQIELPLVVSDDVRELALTVTEGTRTAGAQALAIQRWLTSDAFTYSLAADTGSGDGIATIEDFLFHSRSGYCEQFAGAMAILARELGIPSRLAVGFVPGTHDPDTGAWELTARDLHTWPELWLDGYGWVAFEPTPARGGSNVPDPSVSPSATPTAVPTPAGAPTPTPTPTAAATPQPTAAPVPGQGAGADVGVWWLLGLVLAIAALALAAPRALRVRRRRRRLAGTGDARTNTLDAWDEVRESVTDAALPWPAGSPRFAAAALADRLGDADASAALERLAVAAERALFDVPGVYDGSGSWAEEVQLVLTALARQRGGRSGGA